MVETLGEMKLGAEVESEAGFSWPSWKAVSRSSIGCPTRAMLEGLRDRGLLSVSKVGRRWFTTINEAGQAALLAHEQAQKTKKPSPFKEFGTSYLVTNSLGSYRSGGPRVKARTDNEAISKVKAWLKNRHIGDKVSDIRIDWRPDDAERSMIARGDPV